MTRVIQVQLVNVLVMLHRHTRHTTHSCVAMTLTNIRGHNNNNTVVVDSSLRQTVGDLAHFSKLLRAAITVSFDLFVKTVNKLVLFISPKRLTNSVETDVAVPYNGWYFRHVHVVKELS